MAKLLYIETNFALGIVKGQDPAADGLVAGDSSPIQLVIPGLCFIEAYSAWNQEEKQRRKFIEQLAFNAREMRRDQISTRARTLLSHLEQAQIEGDGLINDTKLRLRQVLDELSRKAVIIDVDREIVQRSSSEILIDDPTDNLILWSVLRHARESPEPVKAFLSRNHQDFDQQDVRAALDQVGVKYFRRTEAALGWLQTQTIADNP